MARYSAALAFLLAGCTLQPPVHTQHSGLDRYKYVLIENIAGTTSISASGGNALTRDVNPGQLIEGLLLKKGLVKIQEQSPQTAGKVLLAKYGVSGKRDIAGGFGGYAQEVTISLVDAQTLDQVFTCSAEGIGSTEADDIREAIFNCMSGLQ